MNIQPSIEQKLVNALTPSHLEVLNESNQHNVPPNSETHFKLVIVAAGFTGQRQVARHQSVYKLLAEELAGPVHALALHTYSPEEWAQRQAAAPDSPACLGGSKAEQE
ncbi:MAG: BolA/IbaG family iron-sulfur metabolism protein [Halieaceae bacterium]